MPHNHVKAKIAANREKKCMQAQSISMKGAATLGEGPQKTVAVDTVKSLTSQDLFVALSRRSNKTK